MHGDRLPKFSSTSTCHLLDAELVLGNMLVTSSLGRRRRLLVLPDSFWFTDEATLGGKKAFVTNRIGDWGFLLASSGVSSLGTITTRVSPQGRCLPAVTATASAAAVRRAIGKSAQIPLYLWCDAMAGPPVSALIHAATMVTVACS